MQSQIQRKTAEVIKISRSGGRDMFDPLDIVRPVNVGILRASNDETQFRRRARRFEQQPLQCGLPVRAVCSKVAQIPTQSRAGGRITVSIDRTLRSEEHTSELQSLMRISYAVFCLKKQPYSHVQ